MAKKNIEDDWSFKIGCIIGELISRFFIFLWNGLKASFKNRYMIVLYACLILLTGLSYFINGDVSNMVVVIFLTVFLYCICHAIKEYPIKKRRKYFNRLFERVKLTAEDETVPYYLYETEISEFAVMVVFASLVPLSMWEAKKELLEVHTNAKIIDIKQAPDNYQQISLIIEMEPLPALAEWSDKYTDLKRDRLNIGLSYSGVVGMDLERQPHAFIAGETGSGKSNVLKCMIHQALIKKYEVILIDFKRGVSFSSFKNSVAVYYEYKDVIVVIKNMILETTRRLDKFRSAGVDNIKDYNRVMSDYLPRKLIFIDELAELLKTRDKELSHVLNDSLETLTRLSRSAGVHLIMGIQRPDSTVISGQIKNNVSYRVCGRFVDKEPSRIMLGSDIASTLPNVKGRFIVKDNDFYEVQCFYFSEISSALQPPQEPEISPALQPPQELEKVSQTGTKDDKKEQEKTEPGRATFNFDFSDFTK